MNNCFIYETLNSVNEMHQTKTEDGLMHLKGTFGVCGVKNNNARIYEAGNYGKMVANMQERLKEKPILGELEHPQTMNITLENVSHKITDISIDENGVVSGEIVLLNTPKGKIAQAIVEGGAPLFISSRAQGSVDPRTSVVTLENLATYDLVGSPGFSQAELHLNEGQVAESICESCGYVYSPEDKPIETKNENNNTEEMDNAILERLEALEAQVQELQTANQELHEANENLQSQIDETESIDKKQLCEGIQKWIIEEFSPVIQNWVVEEFSPEIQNWITEEFSPEVQNWCQNEFAEGLQNWLTEEFSPEVQKWVTENFGAEVDNKITEAVNASKKNSLSNIENTLTMLEGITVKKPTYGTQKAMVTENNSPKYISEMPADVRVKYDLASQEVREAIDRRARIFDFNRQTINEFWEGVDFDNIKPVNNLNEGLQTISDERERAIRAQLMSWHSRRF